MLDLVREMILLTLGEGEEDEDDALAQADQLVKDQLAQQQVNQQNA